jgi:Ca2+-binding RTX toxin-like protein
MRYDGNDDPNTYHGTSGSDEIYGYGGDDWLYGEGGNDYLIGGAGANHLYGGTGIDTVVYSDAENVWVDLTYHHAHRGSVLTMDDDSLYDIENVIGSSFNDVLWGDGQNNTLIGGGGDDIFAGLGGADILIGGDGMDDSAEYGDSDVGVYVNLAAGIDALGFEFGSGYGGSAEGDVLYDIETLYGSDHGDYLVGNSVNNTIDGGTGDDWLAGGGGDDNLYGSFGHDSFEGGAGADVMAGHEGNDTVYYTGSPTGVWASLTTGTGAFGDAQGDTYFTIENLVGSAFADYLEGDGTSNRLFGLDDSDILAGLDGDDELTGGWGGDYLLGGSGRDWALYSDSDTGVWVDLSTGSGFGGTAQDDSLSEIECLRGSSYDDQLVGDGGENILEGANGNDWLVGHDGEDRLTGGFGTDKLMGGGDADKFVWTSINETGNTKADADVILDFDKFDVIDLSQIDADETLAGDQAFTISTGGFTGPGQIALFGDYLLLNTDSDTAAEGMIRVDGITGLDPSWFVL